MTRSRRSRRQRLRRRLGAQLATRARWIEGDQGAAFDDGPTFPEAGAVGERLPNLHPPAFEFVEGDGTEQSVESDAHVEVQTRAEAGMPVRPERLNMTSHGVVEDSTQPPAPGEAFQHQDLLFRAAREALARGEVSRAIGIYRELLERAPNHVRARNNLALVLDGAGDQAGALSELHYCLKIEPDNPQVLVNRGALLGATGHFLEAETDLRRVVQMEPGNAEAHYNLGLVISRKGLWRDAIPHLRRALELDSSRADAYFYLGEALNHVDDLEGALQSYQRAVELRPNNPKALYGMGIVLDRLNRPHEAAQMYRRSREIDGQ